MSKKEINKSDIQAYDLFLRLQGLNTTSLNNIEITEDKNELDLDSYLEDDEYGVGLAEHLSEDEMNKLLKKINKDKDKKKQSDTKRKSKRETSKHTFTGLKPIKAKELGPWEHAELLDGSFINISYGNYDDGINNMEGRMAKRSVRYEVKLIKHGVVAKGIYEEIHGLGKGDPSLAESGTIRYYKIEAVDTMPLQCKIVGYVEIIKDDKVKGGIRKRILLKNNILKEYAARPKNVRKSVEKAINKLVV